MSSKKTKKKSIAEVANTPLTDADVFPNDGEKTPLPFPDDEVADVPFEDPAADETKAEPEPEPEARATRKRSPNRLVDMATKLELEKKIAKLPELLANLTPWEPVMLSDISTPHAQQTWKARVKKVCADRGYEGISVSRAADGIFVVLKD